jgi:antitoxin HicB
MQYSMLIQWSPADNNYLVSFPEFNRGPMTHGATYAKAAKNGGEVLKLLVDSYREHYLPLPTPDTVEYTAEELAEWANGTAAQPGRIQVEQPESDSWVAETPTPHIEQD